MAKLQIQLSATTLALSLFWWGLVIPAVSASGSQPAPFTWPPAQHGRVLGEDGLPIANGRVNYALKTHHRSHTNYAEQVVRRGSIATDAEGRFTIKTGQFPSFTNLPFSLEVVAVAPGHAPWKTYQWFDSTNATTPATNLADLRLPEGRVLVGQCLDEENEPVSGAVVRGLCAFRSGRGSWPFPLAVTDDAGKFEIVAPQKADVSLWFFSRRTAHAQRTVRRNERNPIRVELPRGTSLVGQMESANGTGAEAKVIVLQRHERDPVTKYLVPIRYAAKTRKRGLFRLPPARGTFSCFVARMSRTDEVDGAVRVSEGNMPALVPSVMTFSGSEPQRVVSLETTRFATLRGKVRFRDGRPIPGFGVEALANTNSAETLLRFARTFTDERGEYSVVIPVPIKNFRLLPRSARIRRGGRNYEARVTGDSPQEYRDYYVIELGLVTGDAADLDFVLIKRP